MVDFSTTFNLDPILSKIPKVDKTDLLASFVKQQQRNAKVYEAEGRKYLESWDTRGSDVVSLERQSKPRPHGKEGEERLALMTPVLKPRNPRRASEIAQGNSRAASSPKIKQDEAARLSKLKGRGEGVVKEQTTLVERVTSKTSDPKKRGREKENDNPTEVLASKQSKRKEIIKRRKFSSSTKAADDKDRDEVDSLLEYKTRMNRRREKRREKREIVNPKKRKNLSENGGAEEEGRDEFQNQVSKGKRQKVPVGLALMHGFSATNVGKSRLTLEPTARSAGVFLRGKASAKATTTRKPTLGFSELHFLNKTKETEPEKYEAIVPDTARHGKRRRDQPKLSTKKSKNPLDDTSSQCSGGSDSEDGPTNEIDEVAPRPRASSITWDIERDSAVLPASDVSIPAMPRASPVGIATKKGDISVVDHRPSISDQTSDKANSSVGPHDSASQCLVRSLPHPHADIGSTANVFSKYFFATLHGDCGSRNTGRGSPPSPEEAPSSPPVNHPQGSWLLEDSELLPKPTTVSMSQPAVTGPASAADEGRKGINAGLEEVKCRHTRGWNESFTIHGGNEGNGASTFNLGESCVEDNRFEKRDSDTYTGILQSFPWAEASGHYANFEPAEQFETWGDDIKIFQAHQAEQMGYEDEDLYTDKYAAVEGVPGLWIEDPQTDRQEYGEYYDSVDGSRWDDEPEEEGYHLFEGDDHDLAGMGEDYYTDYGPEYDYETRKASGDAEAASALSAAASTSLLEKRSEGLCQFLEGRSALLGIDIGAEAIQNIAPTYRGVSAAETDVAKTLKNHWRPQRL